ncbi:MAG: hypothetical protein KI790_14075 [Cyclobacteriaceae bacterium]|nr:hypothetical protein [Cyclobacteriaceae bacterium HetDA_MAG_MS6]
MGFLQELYLRNIPLVSFGWLCLLGAALCLIMYFLSATEVLGINAWIKPGKFFISTTIFAWSMAWYTHYLDHKNLVIGYTWVVIGVLAFELIYITWQASKGELSHFNISTRFHSMMFSTMGFAISAMTLFTAYIGLLFFTDSHSTLSPGYLWGIRLGITFFVVFAFEGALMGSQLSHTVGATDGGPGLKLLNWSITHGDLRIAHFFGMHALQVLPIIGFYLFTSAAGTLAFSAAYFIMALVLLIQALKGISFFADF